MSSSRLKAGVKVVRPRLRLRALHLDPGTPAARWLSSRLRSQPAVGEQPVTIVEDTPENMSSTTAFGHESDIEDTLNRAPEKCHYASLRVGFPW